MNECVPTKIDSTPTSCEWGQGSHQVDEGDVTVGPDAVLDDRSLRMELR